MAPRSPTLAWQTSRNFAVAGPGPRGIHVTNAGLEQLKGLTRLRRLHLSSTQIGDAGLAYLKGLSQLQELSLGGTQVGDAGLAYLKGLTRLHVLNLGGTEVTDAGVETFRRPCPI